MSDWPLIAGRFCLSAFAKIRRSHWLGKIFLFISSFRHGFIVCLLCFALKSVKLFLWIFDGGHLALSGISLCGAMFSVGDAAGANVRAAAK